MIVTNETLAGPPICVYCGAQATTRDHVPPRNLFGKSPGELITVPSCARCNGGASQDDEYFRAILTMRRDVEDAPLASDARATAERAWKRPESRGFATMLSSKVRRVMLKTSAGIVYGPEPTVEIDQARIARVLRRVVLGLFYHELGSRLSPPYDAFSFQLGAYSELERDQLAGRLRGREAIRVGGGEFEYRWVAASDDPSVTQWVLRFFDRVIFIGTTWPVDEDGRPRAVPE